MTLVEDTLFGVVNKIERSIERIKQFEPPEGYYVAFSGGKDSICMYDLVKKAGVKYDAHFQLTSLDPKELLMYVKKNYPEVVLDKPPKTIWELIVDNGVPPTRKMRYCCRWLKERGGTDRFVITGVRWAESHKRSQRRMYEVCKMDATKQYLHPIIDWTDEDVWEYIKKIAKIPYCELYDKGFKRIGCIGCPMDTKRREKFDTVFQVYKKAYIKAFDKMLEHRNATGMDKFKHGKTGEEVYQWWTKPSGGQKEDPDQSIMFE